MAVRAQVRSAVAERGSRRALYIMNAMTINTGGNILIAFFRQRRPVDTFLIGVINCTVAFGAGLRDHQPSTQQEFACIFVCQACLSMRIMAVRASDAVHAMR